MSAYLQHNDPAVFPDPAIFQPERWLGENGAGLDKYLVSFGKGTHGCIGSTFAWAQLYLTLAAVHRRFDFDLEPISDWDMEYEDHFVGLHHQGAKRVHVTVKCAH
jgi:cytochrome P450